MNMRYSTIFLMLPISVFLLLHSPVSRAVLTSHSVMDEDCPTVVVNCPAEVFKVGETYTVTAQVKGNVRAKEITYSWSVSSGKIVEGQGTHSIRLYVDKAGDTPTATVEVGGLDAKCENRTASCTFPVASMLS